VGIASPQKIVFGDTPRGCLMLLLSNFSVIQSICVYSCIHSLSARIFRTCRLTSLFARSTMPFSSFEYGMDR